MPTENAKDFLQKLKTDPEAQELLKDIEKPDCIDEMASAIGQVAEKLGYAFSAEEIRSALDEAEQDRKTKTEEAAAEIKAIPDEALDAVAGGGREGEGERKPGCKYSYQDEENCWFKDGCDNTWRYYSDYQCRGHNLGK